MAILDFACVHDNLRILCLIELKVYMMIGCHYTMVLFEYMPSHSFKMAASGHIEICFCAPELELCLAL